MVNEWLNGVFDELLKHAYAIRWRINCFDLPYGEKEKSPIRRQSWAFLGRSRNVTYPRQFLTHCQAASFDRQRTYVLVKELNNAV